MNNQYHLVRYYDKKLLPSGIDIFGPPWNLTH